MGAEKVPQTQHVDRRASVDDVKRSRSIDATAGVEAFKEAHEFDSIEDTKPGAFVWMCAAATAIGGMLFGYDTGVISGVLVVIGSGLNDRPLSDTDKELITTLCAAGAFIGAIVAGVTADKFGRKPATWFASLLFTLGAIVQASSYTIAQMSVGRLLIGLGVGSASMVRFLFYIIWSTSIADYVCRLCPCTLLKSLLLDSVAA
jgi:Sugar (and other) transporter